MLTGCANIQPKIDAFEQQSKRLGTIYAQVDEVAPGVEWKSCSESRISKGVKDAICNVNTNAVKVSWVSRKSAATMIQAVPMTTSIKPGSIVILDMTKPLGQNFIAVASIEESDTCKWVGKSNDKLDSSFKNAAISAPAFMAGALMPIPTLGYLIHERSAEGSKGGVVCNDWNYQEVYKDKDIDSLLDIF